MINFLRILLTVAFVVQGGRAFQTTALPPPSGNYVLRTWSITEGLPQSSVGCILQTRDGYLWVGTWNGLARFDGLTFTTFHSGNTPALRGSKINAIFEDRRGRLWVGTERGLVIFAANRFVAMNADRPLRAVNAIAEDAEGTIWVATDGGLFRAEDSALRFSGSDHRWLSDPMERLHADGSGRLLIGQEGRTLVASVRAGSVAVDTVLGYVDQAMDDLGCMWFLDRGNTLYRMDGTRTTMVHRFSARPSLWPLGDGGMGLCFQDRLVLVRDDGITNITNVGDIDLQENEVVYEDREGNLWLGRASSGLSRLRKKAVTVFDERSGLSSSTITSVLEDHSGTLWAGTHRKGLNYFRKGRFWVHTDVNVHDDAWIGLIWESADRSLWVSGPRMGLVRIDAGGGYRYIRGVIHAETNVVDASEGPDGGLWLATRSDGVQRDLNGRVTSWDARRGLSSNEITCLLPASNGDVWVGTVAGLNRISSDTVTVMTVNNGLTHDDVQVLLEDDDGSVWIGTRRGLNRWKEGVLTGLSEREGLADDAISQMIDDGHGYFWFGGIKGLSRVLKTDLRALADGKVAFIRSHVYGTNAGLIVSEVGGGGNPRVWKTKDGLLWFSSERGLVCIDPATIRENSVAPGVVIEQVTIDNHAVRADTLVVVHPGETKVEFEYTGISFSAPGRVRFQHRLAGFDEEWEDVGVKRFVQYTNLPPGEYTFQVRAANNDGVWNETGAAMALVVLPPFYQSWWFLAIVITFFLTGGPTVYVLRVRALKSAQRHQQEFGRKLIERQEEERRRISRDMHDSLGQELLVLKHRIQAQFRKRRLARHMAVTLTELSNTVSGTISLVRQISHNLRPPELDRLGLTETIRAILERVRSARLFTVRGEVDDIDGAFGKEDEINVVRILQEAINNVIKHARASEMTVRVRRIESWVDMQITDNGVGIDAVDHPDAGIGLVDMRERARLMNGSCEHQRRDEGGTTVHIVLPEKRR